MLELPLPDPPLRTGPVGLRPWSAADVPAIVAACQDPAISEYSPVIPRPYTEADALSWLESQEPSRLAGDRLELAVVHAVSDDVLGAIAVVSADRSQLVASVGYWLAPDARGRGYITSALRLFARWLFDPLGFARLELTTDPENVASQRVAERCGFSNEGCLRSHVLIHHSGQRRDSLMWGLLPDELT